MIESDVESYFNTEIAKAGGVTRKFLGRMHNPDRIVIWPSVPTRFIRAEVHFVELKKPGKKPRAGQARELKRLTKMGCVALYLDTKEKVDLYVKNWRSK